MPLKHTFGRPLYRDRTQTCLKGWAKPLAGVTHRNPTDLHGAALIYANRAFVPTFHDEETTGTYIFFITVVTGKQKTPNNKKISRSTRSLILRAGFGLIFHFYAPKLLAVYKLAITLRTETAEKYWSRWSRA